jgi:hypothetical protein
MKHVLEGLNAQDLREKYHAFLKQYRAEPQRSVSTLDGHIFYSRPVGKWMLARMKGNKVTVTFSDTCPCKDL